MFPPNGRDVDALIIRKLCTDIPTLYCMRGVCRAWREAVTLYWSLDMRPLLTAVLETARTRHVFDRDAINGMTWQLNPLGLPGYSDEHHQDYNKECAALARLVRISTQEECILLYGMFQTLAMHMRRCDSVPSAATQIKRDIKAKRRKLRSTSALQQFRTHAGAADSVKNAILAICGPGTRLNECIEIDYLLHYEIPWARSRLEVRWYSSTKGGSSIERYERLEKMETRLKQLQVKNNH